MALLLRVSADAAAGLKIQPKVVCVTEDCPPHDLSDSIFYYNMHIGLIINKKNSLCPKT